MSEALHPTAAGPCLHAAASGAAGEVTDARTGPRSADHMRRAVELGSLSSLSAPLGSVDVLKAGPGVYAGRPAASADAGPGWCTERHRLTPDQAFHLLARASMGTNRKLRDVADHLVATGELVIPPPPADDAAGRPPRRRAG